MNPEKISQKLIELNEQLNDETIKSASNEELMGYLFLVEKMKKKFEKMIELEGNK